MALQVNWSRLDDTASAAIASMLNQHIARRMSRMPTGNTALEAFSVTKLEWGDVPPFIEITGIDDAMTKLHSASLERADSDSMSFSSGTIPTPVPLSTPPAAVECKAAAQAPPSMVEQLIGPSGLLVKVHLTYGGNLRLSLACRVRQQINLADNFSLSVALSAKMDVQQVTLDCHLNLNLHQDTVTVWLDPPASPQHFLFGANALTTFGPANYVGPQLADERAVAALVTKEIRTLLTDVMVAPHVVTFSLPQQNVQQAAASS